MGIDVAVWVQILDKVVYILLSANTLGEGKHPTIFSPTVE